MDNPSLRDFQGGEGTYVADALERTLLLPTDMAELGNLRRQEAVQVTYRLEKDVKEQSRSLELERDKRLDATRILKNSEVDLLKAREELKEMTRARDSTEAGLAGAQKQVEDQTRHLLEAEDQLKIANEQINDLKKKLSEAEGVKSVAEWAQDEALRAKIEMKFARMEAKSSKEKAEEEAYDLGMAKTQATLKAQVPGVCRLYYSQVWNKVLKQAGVEASSDLWKVGNVYYPSAIRETASANSEAESALEEAEAARPEAALAITTPKEPTEGGELPEAAETLGDPNPEAPQEVTESATNAQASHAKEPALGSAPSGRSPG
ncbi:uncharacterized protein LOC126719222 [Quercus robur]|uniref:uncharacterized protein LOC126719222 n=1 Tax=Quercus robur TaxID=38942 RepID=UPI0021638D9D|nr:uncharacterized protein LOC126719222 [Quercus robur]